MLRPKALLVVLAALVACTRDEPPAPVEAPPPPAVEPAVEPAPPELGPIVGDPRVGGRTVEEWADALDDALPAERTAALTALAAMDDRSRDAIVALFLAGLEFEEALEPGDAAREIAVALPSRFLDALLAATKHPDAIIRAAVFEALQDTAPDDAGRERLLAAAVRGLGDADDEVLSWAYDAFEQGLALSPAPPADGTLAALFALLTDPRAETRSFAVDACVLLGPAAVAAIDELVALLADEYCRDSAMETLGSIGRRAVPPLVHVLDGEAEFEMKVGALEALESIGLRAAPAAAVVLAIARGDDPQLASSAVSTLGALGPAVPEALPIFIAQLSSQDSSAVQEAIDAIRRIGDAGVSIDAAVPALVRILSGRDEGTISERGLATAAIISAPSVAETLPALLAALEDPSRHVRLNAALELMRWPVDGDGAMPAAVVDGLAARCEDADETVREFAVHALGSIPLPPAGVDALVGALRDTDYDTRIGALEALEQSGRLTAATRPIRPELFRLLGDGEASVRGAAARLLVRTPGPMPTLLAEVARGLNDNDFSVVRDTLTALGDAGPIALEFRPDIEAFVTHPWSTVRAAAVEALALIDPYGEATPATLAIALADPDHGVRIVAARALGGLPYSARYTDELLDQLLESSPPLRAAVVAAVAGFGDRALGQVLAALEQGDPDVRLGAVSILRTIDADLAVIAESAAARLEDEDPRIRAEAARVLALRPEAGADYVGAVQLLLEDTDPFVRVAAAASLATLGRSDESVVGGLARGVADPITRLESARALAVLGKRGASAEPALRLALGESDAPDRRLAVVRALAGLGPAARPSIGALTAVLLGEAPGLPHDEDDDTSETIRLAALDALVAIGGPDVRPTIEHGLLDESPEVRAAARAGLERTR